MKKKLTLTVQEDIIKYAKRKAKRKGISVSQMFEEVIGKEETSEIETEQQRAAKRLLELLNKSQPVKAKDDKKLIREHVT
jgi:hypothetical protein